MRDDGYAYAIIGGVGPAAYYAKTVGATLIEGSSPGHLRFRADAKSAWSRYTHVIYSRPSDAAHETNPDRSDGVRLAHFRRRIRSRQGPMPRLQARQRGVRDRHPRPWQDEGPARDRFLLGPLRLPHGRRKAARELVKSGACKCPGGGELLELTMVVPCKVMENFGRSLPWRTVSFKEVTQLWRPE
ncbi:MAG: hypothetical protein MZV70_20760 [Desulfobacterales bacterium]|nr:hypothetical protein [Desulfobacterales bacterium]